MYVCIYACKSFLYGCAGILSLKCQKYWKSVENIGCLFLETFFLLSEWIFVPSVQSARFFFKTKKTICVKQKCYNVHLGTFYFQFHFIFKYLLSFLRLTCLDSSNLVISGMKNKVLLIYEKLLCANFIKKQKKNSKQAINVNVKSNNVLIYLMHFFLKFFFFYMKLHLFNSYQVTLSTTVIRIFYETIY